MTAAAQASRPAVLLTAATVWEASPLRAALGLAPGRGDLWRGRARGRAVALLLTGMGPESTARALAADAEAGSVPSLVLSTGFAGGLDPGLRTGDLVAQELFSCPAAAAAARRASARLSVPVRFGRIADSPRVLCQPREKAALARRTGALAVDMESAAIAAWCRRRRVPGLALRVVLDEAGQSLPPGLPEDPGLLAALRYAAARPHRWPGLAALGLRQRRAMKALTAFVSVFLEEI